MLTKDLWKKRHHRARVVPKYHVSPLRYVQQTVDSLSKSIKGSSLTFAMGPGGKG
jgi:hypothetical protein